MFLRLILERSAPLTVGSVEALQPSQTNAYQVDLKIGFIGPLKVEPNHSKLKALDAFGHALLSMVYGRETREQADVAKALRRCASLERSISCQKLL